MEPRRGRGRPNSTAQFTDEELIKAVHGSSISKVARQLGLSKSALVRRMARIASGRPNPHIGSSLDSLLEEVGDVPPELVLKGTSVLTDKNGELVERWDKTRTRGRDPALTTHLPDPKHISKVSTFFDQEGRVTAQWVSETPDAKKREELWVEAAKAMAEQLPRVPLIERFYPDRNLIENLLTVYPIGDHHMGMLSWKYETGASYDLDIGEELLTKAMQYLVSNAPATREALIVEVGDFLHYDSPIPVTPTNKNSLDADGRYGKMVRAAIRTLRRTIDLALLKHELVHVIIEIGNHDLYSAIWMMEALANIYANNPRVTIDTAPRHFHYYRWRKNLFGVHHGHGVKPEGLVGIMANDRPQDWGETLHRMWFTGHIHQRQVYDFPGCTVESLRILPPTDAWAANNGYRPRREMHAIVFHEEYGEQSRNLVSPWMLEES